MPRRAAQVQTSGVSIESIMRSRAFKQGAADVRRGAAPRFDNPDWDQWHYERGRLWATIAPRSMPLVLNGRLNPAAVALFIKAGESIP